MDLKVRAFNSLTDFITARLKKEKRTLSQGITQATVNISNVASVDVAFYHPRGKQDELALFTQHWMDPLTLLDLPDEKEAIGEAAIEIVEGFLIYVTSSLYALKDFPKDVFENAIADYRAADMTARYDVFSSKLIGTHLKSVITVLDCPLEATTWFELCERGNVLFRKKIATSPAGTGAFAASYPTVEPTDAALEIYGVLNAPTSPVRIGYSELPAQIEGRLKSKSK